MRRVRFTIGIGAALLAAALATIIGLSAAAEPSTTLPPASTTSSTAAPIVTTTSAPSFPPCKVTLAVGTTTATATVVSGCVGPGFVFRSFIGVKTMDLFDSVDGVNGAVVNLPPCAWQIDFAFPADHKLYAFATGGSGTCTTTTTTTPTTQPPPPPTTTVPSTAPPTTTPTTRPVPPTPITPSVPPAGFATPLGGPTTTLPNIAAEQQQVATPQAGVTQGNG